MVKKAVLNKPTAKSKSLKNKNKVVIKESESESDGSSSQDSEFSKSVNSTGERTLKLGT